MIFPSAFSRYHLSALSFGQTVLFFAALILGILAEKLLPEIFPEISKKKARLIGAGIVLAGIVIIILSAVFKFKS